jgi:predicted alpha/beta superfamily hydrolase
MATARRLAAPALTLALMLVLAAPGASFGASVGAAQGGGLTVVSEGAYAPERTTDLIVHSARVGRDFRVTVSAPSGPLVTPGRRLAAIYALDGGYGVAGPVGQMMAWGAAMTPAYVVAVGYPERDGNTASRWRDTDLLFREADVEGHRAGGGAAAFQAFLAEELRPYLEARYPLDPKAAVLFGHSFGGLFAANVLAHAPASYAGYIIASPSVWADPGVVPALAAQAPRLAGTRVFLAVGGAEEARMTDGLAQVAAALAAAPGSAAKVERRAYAGATHIGYFAELAPQAYAWILPPPAAARTTHAAVTLPASDLAQVAGTYDVGDGRKIAVSVKDGRVYAEMTGSPGGEILAEAPRRFFAPIAGFDVTLTFEGPDHGPASAVVVSLNGALTRAVRAR